MLLLFIIASLQLITEKPVTYSYTGKMQKVCLPPAHYVFEVAGGQGGGATGAKGDYVKFSYTFNKYTDIFIYVGGKANNQKGGFNGGGSTTQAGVFGGGGATQIFSIVDKKNLLISAKGGTGQGKTGGMTTGKITNGKRIDATTKYIDRGGVDAAEFTPKQSGTVLFQSTKYGADPWAYLIDGATKAILAQDDDSAGGPYNFKISHSVTKNKKYILRIGSYTQKLDNLGDCTWFATFPPSTAYIYTSVTTGCPGGGANLPAKNSKIIKNYQAGNGFVRITKSWEKTKPNNKIQNKDVKKTLVVWFVYSLSR